VPGVALSLVADQPEQVWWHQCARKDKGRGCRDTRDVRDGGCTKWFDEKQFKMQIEQRLQLAAPIAFLDEAGLQHGRTRLQQLVRALAQPADSAESCSTRVAALKPAVLALASLETQLQLLELSLPARRWGVIA
jgi:hypothetical protein